MIRAIPADRADIEAFLNARAMSAMFPLNNLQRHGMAEDHPRAMRFWLGRKDGKLTDVLAVTMEGMVMPALPSGDYPVAARALAGMALIGMIGPRAQVRGLQAAAGLQAAPATLNRDEPHFALSLHALKVPAGPGHLVPLQTAPEAVILTWMRAYQIEALNAPLHEAATRAAENHRAMCAADSHRVLMDGPTPLAMTGFNARLPGVVQIGGVYTPPERRGQGHARRALALHLAEACTEGVGQATLFSASDMASRAYVSVGFEQIGEWTLLLLDGPQVAHG